MSIPGFGDAVTLFDVSVRIITFINDLRHAQDDLLGLHAEAHTLRVCINAVTSDSCHTALYKYITPDQGRDLKTIVDTCDRNLSDLNRFIASCAACVEDQGKKDGLLPKQSRRGKLWRARKTWTSALRSAFASAWAKYKFSMTDKQPFRDKLVLPTQAVNVFLTSMTHVGLANVGLLMNGTFIGPTPGAGSRAPPPPPTVVSIGGRVNVEWDVVGRSMAFKETKFLHQSDLTSEIEEEMLLYLKHLLKGGDRFSYIFARGRRKFRVTKEPIENPKPKARSRSRSRAPTARERLGPLGLGKGKSGNTYVMRKKSFVKRAGEISTALVKRDWESESDSDSPGGRLLVLPAPEIVEIKPSRSISAPSTDGGGDDDSDKDSEPDVRRAGGGSGDRRRDSSHERNSDSALPARDDGSVYPTESSRNQERDDGRRRTYSSFENRATYRNSRVTDLDARRRQVEEIIEREQEAALEEIERADRPAKEYRRTQMRQDARLKEEEKEEIEEDMDALDTIRYMDLTYGIVITPAEGRPEVDNGEVCSDHEAVKYDPLISRTDRLKAETSLPTMMPGLGTESSKARRSAPRYHYPSVSRSRTEPRYDRFRYMPHYDYYNQPSDEDEYYSKDFEAWKRRDSAKEHQGRTSYERFGDAPYADYPLYETFYRTARRHRSPGENPDDTDRYPERHRPGPSYMDENPEIRYKDRTEFRRTSPPRPPGILRVRKDDQRDRKRSTYDTEPEIDIVDDGASPEDMRSTDRRHRDSRGGRENDRYDELHRRKGRERYEDSTAGTEYGDGPGYYMRGARGPDDDSDEHEIEVSRRRK